MKAVTEKEGIKSATATAKVVKPTEPENKEQVRGFFTYIDKDGKLSVAIQGISSTYEMYGMVCLLKENLELQVKGKKN